MLSGDYSRVILNVQAFSMVLALYVFRMSGCQNFIKVCVMNSANRKYIYDLLLELLIYRNFVS